MRMEAATQPHCETCGRPLPSLSAVCPRCPRNTSSRLTLTKKPWPERDAKIAGGLTLIVRLVFGLIALALGSFFIFGGVHIALSIAKEGFFPSTQDSYLWGVFTPTGVILMAFGLAQLIAVFWVGMDIDQDDRLWVKMETQGRGILRSKRGFLGRFVPAFASLLLLIVLVIQDIVLFRAIVAGLLSFRWESFAALLLTGVTAWRVVLSTRRSQFCSSEIRPEDGTQWISRNSWTIRGSGMTAGATFVFFVLGLGCIAVSLYDLSTPPVFDWTRLYLELNRSFAEVEEGYVRFLGTVAVRDNDVSSEESWHAEIAASNSDGLPLPDLRWSFPAALTERGKDRRFLSFNCVIKQPTSLPYSASSTFWRLSFFQGKGRKRFEFTLPKDAVFLEEIPLR